MKGIFNSSGIKVLDETTIKEAPFFCASNIKLFPLLLLPSIAKKISLFAPYFFAVFFSREVPSSGGAGGSDMGAERDSESFFLPILLKSVQPKNFLVGLAMLVQWGAPPSVL